MTSDEFIVWAMEQPEGRRYELIAGEVVAMPPERSVHALTKFHVAQRLAAAVAQAGLVCTVYPDGMSLVIDAGTTYEPDALVRCGPPLPADAVVVPDPLIVVEVLSPSTMSRDQDEKLIDYFRLPSVQHYLTVRTRIRAIVHHARQADGTILTRIVREGPIHLEPPGITLTDWALPEP
jgi:Uma2 family endonuclease